MSDFLYSRLVKFSGDMRAGSWHMLGALPHEVEQGGNSWKFMNRTLRFGGNNWLPDISAGETPSAFEFGAMALNPAMLAMSMYGGFSDNGLRGAVGAFSTEIATNAAMVRHGYHAVEQAGVTTLHPGAGFAAGAGRFLRKGLGGHTGANIIGELDKFHRYGTGLVVGGLASSMLGGGALGSVGAVVGSSLGVKYAGTITAGLAIAGASRMVGYGAYGVLRSGYNYRQARRQINTDGDMAAFMTGAANSMRERSVAAIQKSYMNTRSALGQESQYLSMPSRSYSSPYRGAY